MKFSAPILAGFDVGGTKIEMYVVDGTGKLLVQRNLPTPATPADEIIPFVVKLVRDAAEELKCQVEEIAAVGLGIPGQVEDGVVRLSVNLRLSDDPLEEKLTQALGIPCAVENDVRTAVMGVWRYFQERESIQSLAFLSIGTGIGAGVVLDGKLRRGSSGVAGEVGHIPVDANGPECACGMRGCLEVYASGPAIARQAADELKNHPESSLHSISPLTGEAVYRAARDGDPLALEVVNRSGCYLAQAIYSLVMSYDPDRIVIGGGVSSAGETFMKPVEQALSAMRQQSPLAERVLSRERVFLLPADFKAGAWGAIELARWASNKNPRTRGGEREDYLTTAATRLKSSKS